ncbi:MAG: glycosyltransferase family 39 protein [Candidatus Omnitrophota bacterium]|nr:glycosyltransferase family 39 protein [Candidatus Omnitrophota bacterium]
MAKEGIRKALFSAKFYCPIIHDTFVNYYGSIIKDNALLLRLPSVLFGVISIGMVYCLGELLFNKKAGLFSAFILAISPFHIYYSREIRMYSLIALLSLISVYFLVKAMRENKDIYWFCYSISNIIGIYVHPIVILFFIAEVMFFIFHIKKYNSLINKWLKFHFFIFILLTPWIISMLSGLDLVIKKDDWFFESTISWIPQVTWASVFYTFKNFSIGYNAVEQIYFFAVLLFFALFLWEVFKKDKESEGKILVLMCLFVPILFAYSISKFRACYLDRYFIPSSLFYYLIIGKGLSGLNKKFALLILSGIIFLSLCALKNYYANYLPGAFEKHIGVCMKKDQEGAANYVAKNFQKGDIIFHACLNTVPSFEYYFSKAGKSDFSIRKNLLLKFSKKDNNLMPFEYNSALHKFIDQSECIDLENKERIWLIFSGWDFEEAKQPYSPESKMIRWMNEHYAEKDNKEFSGIIVYLYIKAGL